MNEKKPSPKDEKAPPKNTNATMADTEKEKAAPKDEIGGFGEKGNKMPEPTRFGDWEIKGRCSDF